MVRKNKTLIPVANGPAAIMVKFDAYLKGLGIDSRIPDADADDPRRQIQVPEHQAKRVHRILVALKSGKPIPQPGPKEYCFGGHRGCVTRFKNRETNTMVSIWHNEQGGFDPAGGKWSMICDDHDFIIAVQSLDVARDIARHPLMWCEVCNGNISLTTIEYWENKGEDPETDES